ncbi:YkvA family protein [Modicisalibacter tunisiensis]|uniref:DUF1232 domain-containing protein n=1 Tax=Modicisalibacter tunisiensis TaxID=390637 RepID=A0ABS7WWR8_9GAMM|nr:DUF1232 domain-containing protein [Modicisalibacter tunisiensis]MBZ9566790.1 DUF1232 domain-containing protein [Modicisalibacter tunisiensis]
MWQRLKAWAGALKREVAALYLATRDPRTPAAARWLALAVIAYALSPIDLIPDFIPVLGYLDDLLLLPLGIWLCLHLIPDAVMQDCRRQAATRPPAALGRRGAILVIALYGALVAAGVGWWLTP